MAINEKRLQELKKVRDFNFEAFKSKYGNYETYKFEIMGLIQSIAMNPKATYSDLSLLDKELLLKELGIID